MLADRTNTYQNNKRVQLDLKYVAQTFEKTQQLSLDVFPENTDVRSSMTTEESEVEKLSLAYADKYYYEMKFEQYQNLLTQQQGTITKLLNEKKDLIQRLESIKSNEKEVSLLQQLEIKFIESQKEKQILQIENQQHKYQVEQLIDANNELQQQIETMNREFYEYKEEQNQYSLKQQQLIEKLTGDLNNQKYFQEIQKQMHSIQQQNNQLFEQLNSQEEVLQTTLHEMQEKFSIQQEELTQQYESQLEQKEEELHQMKLDYEKLKQELYNENQQLQNQVEQLSENYREDIQAQANMLSQQVAEYKIVIQNLENQLYQIQDMKQRERASSKDSMFNSRLISNYIKFKQ